MRFGTLSASAPTSLGALGGVLWEAVTAIVLLTEDLVPPWFV